MNLVDGTSEKNHQQFSKTTEKLGGRVEEAVRILPLKP
jgi:hypothetical protein